MKLGGKAAKMESDPEVEIRDLAVRAESTLRSIVTTMSLPMQTPGGKMLRHVAYTNGV